MVYCDSCKKENNSTAKFCIYCGKPLINKSNNKFTSYKNHAIGSGSIETVQRYGSAVKEHVVAYTGKDNQTGIEVKKGLKKISQSKLSSNPKYKKANLTQQAGFAGENKYTARQNAKNIIKKNGNKVHNTDVKGSGSYNQLFDHVITDKNGNIISQEQMKLVGNSPRACLTKLLSKDYEKYYDANATITVPKEYYEGVEIKGKNVSIFTEIDKDVKKLQKQLDKAKQDNNKELTEQLQGKIHKLEKVRHSVKNSGITKAEAMEARLHPELSTAKDVGKISLQAGGVQALIGLTVSGITSIIQNIVAVHKKEKTVDEAVKDSVGDTVKGTAVSFATGSSGSLIKGFLQNSSKEALRDLSETNFAATLVTSSIEITKTIKKFINKKISGLECFEELGEKGTGQVSATLCAIACQELIPIPVVGAMIGSMVGYILSTACYRGVIETFKEQKLSKDERIRVEKECKEIIILIRNYQTEMNNYMDQYLSEHIEKFNNAFDQMYKAIALDDIDGFIGGANTITKKLNGNVQFKNFNEFDTFMNSSESFKL